MKPARRTTAAAATAVVLLTSGGLLTAGVTPAPAATGCVSPVYQRQFYANTTFSGTPKRTDCDSAVDQNWGSGAPAPGLPANNFGVRWTVTRDFGSGGPFAFTASAQDGVRVYLDGVRKIDLWKNVSSTVKKTVNVTVPAGRHTLRVDFVNWTGTANVHFSYTPRTAASVDKVRPLVPAGAAVTYDKATGKAKVTWSRNKEMDLAGYRVHRRLKGSGTWTRLTTTTATSHTDTPPKTGAVYYYEVRALDKAGNESAGTADLGVTTVDKTPPAAPSIELDTCATDETVAGPELVTTAANAAGIARYEAQRQNPATGAWTTVHTGAKGAFCDPGQPADGTKATYRGRARDAAGNWSAYSAATTLTLTDRTPPAAPADARVDYRGGVPHLTWTPVKDAVSYEVWQYDPTTWEQLNALGTSPTTTATDVVPLQQTAVAEEYRYAVRALDAAGNPSPPTGITVRQADRTEPIAPYQVVAARRGDALLVRWRGADPWAVDDVHLPAYRILRTDPATGETVTVEQCAPLTGDGPPGPPSLHTVPARDSSDPDYVTWPHPVVYGECVDASGASETTYEYRVVTVDRFGHASAPSAPATATTGDTVRPAPVTGLTAEVIPMGVHLSWEPSPEDDVFAYRVWQGTTDPATGRTVWKRDCVGGDSLSETEIYCPTLPDGREHVYRVAAIDRMPAHDEGPESFLPAEITVTLPDTRPPGWSGTGVTADQYPELSVRCGQEPDDPPCANWTDYRFERWNAATASWTTLATGKVDAPQRHMDTEVHEDRLGLYHYRAVYSDPSGAEKVMWEHAYGIWDTWL